MSFGSRSTSRRTALVVALVAVALALAMTTPVTDALEPGSKNLRLFFDHQLDRNEDGVLTADDLLQWSHTMDDLPTENDPNPEHAEVEPEQIAGLLADLDTDANGVVTYDEFKIHFDRLRHPYPQPTEVHLALTSNPTEMVVMWLTEHSEPSIVQYGLDSTNISLQATGEINEYSAVSILGEWKGYVHRVTLKELTPSQQYFYRCGSSTNWTQVFDFFAAPQQTVNQTSFALIGDMGTVIPYGFKVSEMMADHFAESGRRWDFTVHAGDVAYAGTSHKREWEFIWDLFQNQVEPFAARAPYMVAVGNHEKYYDYRAYRNRFWFPGNHSTPISQDAGNLWYSFDHGLVHVTCMSTEHPYNVGTPQYEFLRNDLAKAAANREQRPWIFLVGHRPMYCSDKPEYNSHNGDPTTDNLQAQLEPLLHQYAVDGMFTGHMHMYERVFPVFRNQTVTPTNTNHFVSPSAPFYLVQGNSGAFVDYHFVQPQPLWSAVRLSEWGYGRFDVNRTHLHYEFINLETKAVKDEMWITK